MANINTTQFSIYASSPDTIKWLDSVWSSQDEEGLTDTFTDASLPYIDRIGSKWWMKNEHSVYQELEFYCSIDSAWYPPNDFLQAIMDKVNAMDPEAYMQGRYWDEAYSPCGVFYIRPDEGLEYVEGEPHTDWSDYEDDNPDGDWFSDVIDPLFDSLNEQLDDL